MNQQEIKINERSTIYDIKFQYHSDLACENYDAQLTAVEESDGRVTFRPWKNGEWDGNLFEFNHSDPDRIIAIANMMCAFAQMVKKDNQKAIDTENDI